MRQFVGVDLGTTNCALAATQGAATPVPLPVIQLVGPGEIATRATLPSALWLPNPSELEPASLALPWAPGMRYAVGAYALRRGADQPQRLVTSAKSWLSHQGAPRTERILPWRGATREETADDSERVSPVNASARYLAHLRAAWDHAHDDAPLAEQHLVITVPASFDPVAQELTVTAAAEAGLDKLTLLEEPQAAFYAYLAARGEAWRQELTPGDVVLVCDIGGGTTDFSLIAIEAEAGNLKLTRVAVGDHILLGGDNMDLALAALATQRLAEQGKSLDMLQQRALTLACQTAKEQLFSAATLASVPLTIAGRGSRLLGNTLRTEVTQADVQGLLEGFFPTVAAEAAPARRRPMGLRELGLPYAHDAAITRHLADFIRRHGVTPTAILFNGGVLKAPALQQRVCDALQTWTGTRPKVLGGTDLDLAVAVGAAHFAAIRAGHAHQALRIRGGTARAYYIGIESAAPAIPGFSPPIKALCVAPQGMEEGATVELPDDELGLVVGEQAAFRFFAARDALADTVGALREVDAEAPLTELPAVEKHIPVQPPYQAGDIVAIKLVAHISELGTLELWCHDRQSDAKWKLEYAVRE